VVVLIVSVYFDQKRFARNNNAMRSNFASINIRHLVHNYQLLQQCTANAAIMAVVKANAYGHGICEVSSALYRQGCRSFAVTDVDEGALLRRFFQQSALHDADIIVLSGVFSGNGAALCEKNKLTPVLSEKEQLALLKHAQFKGEVWLKVDTGMHRIGVSVLSEMLALGQECGIKIKGMMSHFACADSPKHPLNQQQIDSFQALQQTYPKLQTSMLNSAGIVAFSQCLQTDIVRPGLALYGAEPIPAQPLGLKPVMQLCSSIMQIRPISAGESVSYGATWTASKPAHIAVVPMGYADGLSRLLSNQGEAWHESGRLSIVGRVCMDYCMLEVDAERVKVGDKVIFFGHDEGVPLANDVARQCQSIAYTLFTSISPRVSRMYSKE